MKTDIDDADVTFSSRVFESRAAATGKARSPMVERQVDGTTSNDVDAQRRHWRASSADDWWSSSAGYGGAVWCRHLYTSTASLNLMRSGTFSQRSWRSAAECSTAGQQRPEKLDRRWFKDGCVGWQAMMMKWSYILIAVNAFNRLNVLNLNLSQHFSWHWLYGSLIGSNTHWLKAS